MSARDVLSKAMTEDELLTAIIEAATWNGWLAHHVRRSDKAIQQGRSGFPDLVLARNGRVLFLELKSEGGRVSPDQGAWLEELTSRSAVQAWIIYPSQLDDMLRVLRDLR